MVDVVINKVEIEQKQRTIVVGVSTTSGATVVCSIPRNPTSIDAGKYESVLRAARRILGKALDRSRSRSRSPTSPSMPPTPEHVIATHMRVKHEGRTGGAPSTSSSVGADLSPHTPADAPAL